MTVEIVYDPTTGTISAYGRGLTAPDGLFLGVVYDDAPFAEPGTKALVGGVVVVTPPPAPTADEVAAQQAAAQQDAGDHALMQTLYPQLVGAIPALQDPATPQTTQELADLLADALIALKGVVDRMQRRGL